MPRPVKQAMVQENRKLRLEVKHLKLDVALLREHYDAKVKSLTEQLTKAGLTVEEEPVTAPAPAVGVSASPMRSEKPEADQADNQAGVNDNKVEDKKEVNETGKNGLDVSAPAWVPTWNSKLRLLCEITDEELIKVARHVLMVHGNLTVGTMGSLMHKYMGNHNLPTMLKDKFGGLKKFLAAHEDNFVLGGEHAFNPLVSLNLPGVPAALSQTPKKIPRSKSMVLPTRSVSAPVTPMKPVVNRTEAPKPRIAVSRPETPDQSDEEKTFSSEDETEEKKEVRIRFVMQPAPEGTVVRPLDVKKKKTEESSDSDDQVSSDVRVLDRRDAFKRRAVRRASAPPKFSRGPVRTAGGPDAFRNFHKRSKKGQEEEKTVSPPSSRKSSPKSSPPPRRSPRSTPPSSRKSSPPSSRKSSPPPRGRRSSPGGRRSPRQRMVYVKKEDQNQKNSKFIRRRGQPNRKIIETHV